MAISVADMQAALGTTAQDAKVLQHQEPVTGSAQVWYVVGNLDAPGRAKWVTTTAADDAATQAAAVLTALQTT